MYKLSVTVTDFDPKGTISEVRVDVGLYMARNACQIGLRHDRTSIDKKNQKKMAQANTHLSQQNLHEVLELELQIV